jgi:hypothetical protein
VKVEHPGGAIWGVRGNNRSVRATSDWGTERMPAPQIAKSVLEQRPIQVTDETDDGKRIVNATETTAAQEKAQALQARFAEWVWEDPERATRLIAEYNRRFNSLVLRDYTAEGERLTLPGLARTFTPLPHQRSAVARILSEPAVGLFHAVGAGKTAEMVIGATELRRLGMISKPAVVVPNHMLEQFSTEWLQLYPQARLLAASANDLAGEKRRTFVARAATNDWDAIVMTRSAFERIPVSETTHTTYVQAELEDLRAMLANARGGDGLTVKRVEKAVLAGEQRLKERLDNPKDRGVCWENTGVDYLLIDEAHSYKNLRTASNIRDAAIDGSKRASDLHMKIEYLRSRHGERVATMATATPIANSITEAHVMQRYLRPDLLAAAGVEDFDAWAATFGELVTEIEMAPTGGGSYRMHTRFARFQNVPEMLRMWHLFADVKTHEDLSLPTPQIAQRADGKRLAEAIVIEAAPDIRAYVEQLGERAERVRSGAVTPEEDNMLKICTDGRKAALDMRLATGQPTTGRSKLDVAAGEIARIWREHRDHEYIDPHTGTRSLTRGALQIVFCDLGTPTSPGWSAYGELRDLLAAHGVPREAVRFIHEARNDAEKARLFAAARDGHVSVLIGSTEKMGVGTNIQARAVALHHLDCPWRPADVEQRDGRGIRQGNQNTEIGVYRYVVNGSFDAYSWQTVERKAKFIAQVTRGRLDVRAIEDIGDSALSFQEVKALASGDPLILEKASADAELTRLQRLHRAWQRNQHTLTRTISSTQDRARNYEEELRALADAIARRRDTCGERFAMRIADRTAHTRPEAAQLITAWIRTARPNRPAPLGELGGLDVYGVVYRDLARGGLIVKLGLHGLPSSPATLELSRVDDPALSLVRQLEHRVGDLEALAERIENTKNKALAEAQTAREALKRPFKYAPELTGAQRRVAEISEQMRARQADRDQPQHEQDRDRLDRERDLGDDYGLEL